jgi:hypothetical protein
MVDGMQQISHGLTRCLGCRSLAVFMMCDYRDLYQVSCACGMIRPAKAAKVPIKERDCRSVTQNKIGTANKRSIARKPGSVQPQWRRSLFEARWAQGQA